MKQSLKFIAYISLVLNTLFIVMWIQVFSKHDDHNDRVKEFDALFPGELSGHYVAIALIVLTIISIVGFAQSNRIGNKILLVMQVLFLALFGFSYL